MITIDELKRKIEETGYIATEELIFDTFNALCMFDDNHINPGQDIYAICLEGPPGAGKTEFAKTYTKLSNKMFYGNVELVDYQCDATTGKTELFEDINISAAIRGDADNVNIPGKLVEAIKKVNSGKKVVLFIDEYDKAREETDAFLLQFLQSGKINSTQHGDLEVQDKYKSNLQVILCKNDMREELSGPLSRRIRIIRLDYMEPSTFYEIATRTLVENKEDKVNDGLLNLVALMYQKAYDSKEMYNRLPSCSEMLIALEDADRLMKKANAPQYIIYKTIIKNMFKSLDDIKTFESSLDRVSNENNMTLSALISSMKVTEPTTQEYDLNSLIAEKVFKNESKKLTDKVKELENLITEYSVKFAEMEEKRKHVIEKENEKILLENGKLVSTSFPNVVKNFEDESAYVKRGYNIFELSNNDWTNVAEFKIPELSHHVLIDKLLEFANSLGVVVYENGVLLAESSNGELKIIAVRELDNNNKYTYKIMSSLPIIPSCFLSDILNFISFATEVFENQTKTNEQLVDQIIGENIGDYTIDCLAYDDTELDFDKVEDNIYHIELIRCLDYHFDSLKKDKNLLSSATCNNLDNAIAASNKIMSGKRKVLRNE